MDNTLIPIALFAYSRPDHLSHTLDGLRKNEVPLIYAFCDGPKDKFKVGKVKEVRDVLRNVAWTDIIITERKTNWGLGNSVRAGVSEVLKKHDKVIVIEDDIVMRPGAYEYTCKALRHFESDDRIMTISMWSHPILTPKKCTMGFFSKRFVCWGWGTYKKYWEFYNEEPEDYYNKCTEAGIKLDLWGNDIKWQVEHARERNLWYVGYLLIHFLKNKVSFFPKETLTLNIGRDASGENSGDGEQDDFNLIDIPVFNFSPSSVNSASIANPKKFRAYFNSKKTNILNKVLNALAKFIK